MANRPTVSEATVEQRPATPESASRMRHPGARAATARFYVCVAILLLAAASMQWLAHILEVTFRKEPVPLKRPLDTLDQRKLLPEYEPHRVQPEALSDDLLESLGTEEYLQWYLRERRRPSRDPTAVAKLFVTYYTGQPADALVPHNPKECLAAAGMSCAAETSIKVNLPGPRGAEVVIPVRVLEFELPRRRRALFRGGRLGTPRLVVAYFFYANGRYVTSRRDVRLAIANLGDRHAYYSKIELAFTDDSLRRLANREQTIAATRRLLPKIMPILWEDHYQDWEALEKGAPPAGSNQQG